MATHIGTGESLPRIVITPNKGFSREGAAETQTVAEDAPRLTPAQIRNRSALRGREAAAQIDQEPSSPKQAAKEGGGFWGHDGFTFGDLIDIINPLQHIPVVSTVYRAITGDEIGAGPRMIGGGLLGGAVGFAASALGAAVESQTGKDMGDHILTALNLADEAEVNVAVKAAAEREATLLSSADPVSDMETESLAAADTVTPPPTAEEVLQQAGIALGTERDLSKDRAIYALGGMEDATQRYQQAQSMSRLQNTAMAMDIKG